MRILPALPLRRGLPAWIFFPIWISARLPRIHLARHSSQGAMRWATAPNALEVLVAQARRQPTLSDLRDAWKKRSRGRSSPVLIVACHAAEAKVALLWSCGPRTQQQAACLPEPASRPDGTHLPRGPRRCGPPRCFATAAGDPARSGRPRSSACSIRACWPRTSWNMASNAAPTGMLPVPAASRCNASARKPSCAAWATRFRLLPGQVSALLADGSRIALGLLLNRNETFDQPGDRFSGLSPVSYALARADR